MNIPITWMTFHPYGEEDDNRRRTVPIKPHPTDPDKLIYVKSEYNLPKEWVGLTDDEMGDIRGRVQEYTPIHAVEYGKILQYFTEEALKEKNT